MKVRCLQFILLPVLLLSGVWAFAQEDYSEQFRARRAEGMTFIQQENFRGAINKFMAARVFARRIPAEENNLDSFIQVSLQKWEKKNKDYIDTLTRTRDDLRDAEVEARSAQREAEKRAQLYQKLARLNAANRLALVSENEQKAGHYDDAFYLAFRAYELIHQIEPGDSIPPEVIARDKAQIQWIFGNAIAQQAIQKQWPAGTKIVSFQTVPQRDVVAVSYHYDGIDTGPTDIDFIDLSLVPEFPEEEELMVTPLAGGYTEPVSFHFSEQGDHLLTYSRHQKAKWWTLVPAGTVGGASLVRDFAHNSQVLSACFSPQGERVLLMSRDGSAHIYTADTKQTPLLLPHEAEVYEGHFSTDQQYVLTRSAPNRVHVWDQYGQPQTPAIQHQDYVYSARFAATHHSVVSAGADQTIQISTIGGESVPIQYHSIVKEASFSPQGHSILSVGLDTAIRIWDEQGIEKTALLGHRKRVVSAVFNQSGDQVLSWSLDGTARIWHLAEGPSPSSTVLQGQHEGPIIHACWSPDERWILTTAQDGYSILWDAQGQAHMKIALNTRQPQPSIFSEDSQKIITLNGSNRLHMYPLPALVFEQLQTQSAFADHIFAADLKLHWDNKIEIPAISE